LHGEINLDAGGNEHVEEATIGTINAKLLLRGNVDERCGKYLLRRDLLYFEDMSTEGEERILG